MSYYILDAEGNPVQVANIQTWGQWFEDADRTVAKTAVGEAEVSTVFLGADHSWGRGAPVLYETMIFGGQHDQFQVRYCTRAEAEAGHAQAVAALEAGADPYEAVSDAG